MILLRQSLSSAGKIPDSAACLLCQWRSFSTTYRQLTQKQTPQPAAPIPPPSPLEDAPRSYGKSVDEFTPQPLSRPIGLQNPPRIGDNRGVDTRSWRQRRDDFVNYDKHLVRREQLKAKISTPYFREWSNMRMHKGKSFLAPPRLFKAERALYFPNFYGQTLNPDKILRDTTPTLNNKVSIVSVFSSQWAENQANTFASEKQNAQIHELVRSSGGLAQMVKINIEENSLKAWLVKVFMGGLRKKLGKENWGRYFLVRNEITTDIRDAVGLLNSKVGYTYLLDGECRIRWAGSGPAEGDEKEGLVKGARRLIEEARMKGKVAAPVAPQNPVDEKVAASVA